MQATYQKTKEIEAEFANPSELVVLLYQQAILQLTYLEHKAEDMTAQSKFIAILDSLIANLNQEQGGKLAEMLYNIYIWSLTSVVRDKQFNDVKTVLTSLLDAWRLICK